MNKINVSNEQKLTEVLKEVQHRAIVRTITYSDIVKAVEHIESRLERLLPVTAWRGIKVQVDINAQTFPGAYRGTPESTQFALIKGSSDWFVSAVSRGYVMSPSQKMILTLTDDHKEKMVNHIVKNF